MTQWKGARMRKVLLGSGVERRVTSGQHSVTRPLWVGYSLV